MNQQISFSQDSFVTMILAGLILLFLGGEVIVKGLIKSILEKGKNGHKTTPSQLQMYLRACSADSILRFVSLLLKISTPLTLMLGLAKVYSELASHLLPEHTLGFTVLIGYCGLINILRMLAPDILRATKKLF